MERTTKSGTRSDTVVLAGMVLDILTNQPVQDVHVYQLRDNGTLVAGMVTGADGMYVLELLPDLPLRLSHVSYEAETADVGAGGELVHYLVPATYELPEVEIFPEPGPDATEPKRNVWPLVGLGLLTAWAAWKA